MSDVNLSLEMKAIKQLADALGYDILVSENGDTPVNLDDKITTRENSSKDYDITVEIKRT